MYIAPGQGQTMPWGLNFDPNKKALSLWPFVASFKNISFNSYFLHIFKIILYMYIAPGQGQTNPWGQNFYVNRKLICCKFKKNLFEFWFDTHFLMFFHMYRAPGQGQTTLCGQNSDVNRKASSLCPFVAGFKKISLVWFYTYFCLFFYTRI